MIKYRANANVLNLRPGDVFESADPFYEPYAKAGYLTVVSVRREPVPAPPATVEPVQATEEPSPESQEPAAPKPKPKATRKRTVPEEPKQDPEDD